MPRPPARPTPEPRRPAAPSGADGSLLAILDRLTSLLERSDLTELEVEAGGTGLILRKASVVAPAPVAAQAVASDRSPAGRRGRRRLTAGRRSRPR